MDKVAHVTHAEFQTEARFPYDPDVLADLRRVGAQWDPRARCWWTNGTEPEKGRRMLITLGRHGYRIVEVRP